jgi:hypothetical protein
MFLAPRSLLGVASEAIREGLSCRTRTQAQTLGEGIV